MDFGDPYYKKLMTLVQSNEKNATADLWKVVDEVAAFYQQNGFTEYWVSPAEDDMNTFQGTAWKQEKPFPLKKRPDESASNVAQRAVESGSQEKNVTIIDSESSSSADLSKRKRPSKLSVAGFQGKKSLGSDVLPPTGRIGQVGIACVVCKKLGFTNGNSVIECQECHDMYHQKAQATTPPSVSVPEKLSAMGKNPPSLKSSAADNPLGKMFSRFEATGAFGYCSTSTATPEIGIMVFT
ncbi:Integrator complex subunit 12 [Trichuris trichiura]|uniref:Integrator complex subunit 12 n=1 Tax=Trichuris trichiura TaxID=36087 RepID=A0A077ZIG4_TRITR|nr:Integrator complex subunit 12 [Trichuris trichiura]